MRMEDVPAGKQVDTRADKVSAAAAAEVMEDAVAMILEHLCMDVEA